MDLLKVPEIDDTQYHKQQNNQKSSERCGINKSHIYCRSDIVMVIDINILYLISRRFDISII